MWIYLICYKIFGIYSFVVLYLGVFWVFGMFGLNIVVNRGVFLIGWNLLNVERFFFDFFYSLIFGIRVMR